MNNEDQNEEEEEGEIVFQLTSGVKPGARIERNMDYELWEMTPDQREVFEALECEEEGLYEELEDDFVLEANEGVIPMKLKTKEIVTSPDLLVEKQFQKLLKEEYQDNEEKLPLYQDSELDNTKSHMEISELKKIIKKDIISLNVKVRNNANPVRERNLKVESVPISGLTSGNVQREHQEKDLGEDIRETKKENPEAREVKPEEMGLMELECYYRKPNKVYELLEKKTTKMEGGGLFIFKRVKKRKPVIKKTHKQIAKELKESSPVTENPKEIKLQPKKEFKEDLDNIKSTASDMEFDDSETNSQMSSRDNSIHNHPNNLNPKVKNAWKKDEFIKNLDRMMAEEEIIGLTSSSEEEGFAEMIQNSSTGGETNRQKVKKEVLVQLEKEYQARQEAKEADFGLLNNYTFTKQSLISKDRLLLKEKQKEMNMISDKLMEEEQERELQRKRNFKEPVKTISKVSGLEILPSKSQRKEFEFLKSENQSMQEYLKSKGLLMSKSSIQYIKDQSRKEEEDGKHIPTMEEYFGVGPEDVGQCGVAPQEAEIHQNIFCMKVVKEELFDKAHDPTITSKPKNKRKIALENDSDYEEVENEDIGTTLKRKRKETKEERKLRKKMIKDRKNERKLKKKVFKSNFDQARKERIWQDKRDKELGTIKGVPCYRIN